MEEPILSSDEKEVLRFLYDNRYGDIEKFNGLSKIRVNTAVISLRAKKLISAHCDNDNNVASARIDSLGITYIDKNPNLEDPISADIESLTKQNLILQNNELEYQIKIRKQKTTIRIWQLISLIFGVISVIVSFKG